MDFEQDFESILNNLTESTRGRVAEAIDLGTPRPLSEEELSLGQAIRVSGAKNVTSAPPILVKIRSRHHLIAQLLATGMKAAEVSRRTGYSPSRISILQNDPTFKELLEAYKGHHENVAFDVRERLRQLSLDTIDVLQQRIDEDPDQFSSEELFQMAELSLDRTGVGKSSTVQHNFGIDPEMADFLKQNRGQATIANLLEGEILEDGSAYDPEKEHLDVQLDLFPQDQGPGGPSESQVPSEAPELYPAGEGEQSISPVGPILPEELDEVRTESSVVPFTRVVARSGPHSSGPVDGV